MTHALTNAPKHTLLCMTDYWKPQFLSFRMTTSARKTSFILTWSSVRAHSCQPNRRTLMSLAAETVPWLSCIWRQDRSSLYLKSQLENSMMLSRKRTMDKTLENTLKAGINTELPTCDDKGVFTDDNDTNRKGK